MKITVDRFENDLAVVLTDDGKNYTLPKALLENGKEGDVFDIFLDEEETKTRCERIKKLMDEVWK